ncbi:MAG: M24 family metallopeptidase [Bacteroidota bacterium]
MSLSHLNVLRSQLVEKHFDAFLLNDPALLRFFTGFTGSSGLLFVTRRSSIFVTDGRYKEQVAKEVDSVRTVIAEGSLFETLGKHVKLPHGAVVGVSEEHLTLAQAKTLRKHLRGVRLRPASSVLQEIVSIKKARELHLLVSAIRLSEFVFNEILDSLRPGVKEIEIAAEITYLHRRFGAERDAFEPIVASGWRSALPHAHASEKKLKHRELVLLDFGCFVGGFASDLTRTVAIGKPASGVKRMYEAVLEAQSRAMEKVAPGIAGKEIDRTARDVLTKYGYGNYFVHSTGHGLGVAVHESPRLSSQSKDVLQSGNVVTIEPGVYIPHIGGIRIEDDVLVTEKSSERLTRLSRDLLIV